MAKTQYEKSFDKTLSVREEVPHELKPLFDHIMRLSLHSHAMGYAKRAGIELRKARKLAGYK